MENNDLIKFLGWRGAYALFEITHRCLSDGQLEEIIVAHEGNWTTEEGMVCHREYTKYEDVQDALGEGLEFECKELSQCMGRSLFKFKLKSCAHKYVLAVPATGEEICFEIYGSQGHNHGMHLLVEREL